jgi:putative flippase GtrA
MSAALRVAGQSQFVRFGLVGVLGFVVDAGVLQALVTLAGWGPIAARLVAVPTAVFATWLLNRTITFAQSHGGSALRSLLRYVAVSAAGAGVNFCVYSLLVFGSASMAALPILPLAIASIVALVVNFLGSKHFAFANH